MHKIAIDEKFSLFDDRWRPKTVAELNGQEVKLVKVEGTFPWHSHADVDELFLVWRGRLRIAFRDHVLDLGPGEMAVVPRGVEHRTAAETEAEILIIEPRGIVNTGDVVDARFTSPGRQTI